LKYYKTKISPTYYLKIIVEIYSGNETKVTIDNQLSEEHKLITKSYKAALYHPHHYNIYVMK
jgi:hypothetical protein